MRRMTFLPLSLVPALLAAQGTQTALIRGRVLDGEGRPLAEARVRATSPSLQGARVVTTDAEGQFALRFLPPGRYEIEATKEGFQTVRFEKRLTVDESESVLLRLAEISSVTVTERGLPPEIDLNEVQHAVRRRMTEDIKPLPAEQNLDDILQTFTPGVADTGLNAPHIRGAMSTGNVYFVDGQNIQDGFQQASGISLI